MRPPAFWYTAPDAPDVRSRLLSPLGALYAAGTARRLRKGAAFDPGVPVICVGNINAGGTGKTPTVIALQMMLAARGQAAHVVSRGYGGKLDGPVRVEERAHSAADVGDEPLLLAAFGPTWVSRDRAAGAACAVGEGASVVLLDDGFQNPSVAKSLSIVVVDAWRGFGNGRVLPAGPLREPVQTGLARADLVLTIGPEEAQARFDATWAPVVGAVPRLRGLLKPLQTGLIWTGLRVVAFAGIGHPEKFFATLHALGAEVVATHPLEDHQPLDDRLLGRLIADAKAQGAQLVTTEKDAVRLPQTLRSQVLSLPVRLELVDPAPLETALDHLLTRRDD
ncbi:tetraacyldisaccharide 4'-kinase [Tropicimonas sp. S265A]|uniref:tetraacyldisaccharide 4'-kinase n=1 Tax=Tropicimonas sp. S265A TaxID=3415134 RepID=UPI003C7DA290